MATSHTSKAEGKKPTNSNAFLRRRPDAGFTDRF
jgi:hypothetical protein